MEEKTLSQSFLAGMLSRDFPSEFGPWLSCSSFAPSFKRKDFRWLKKLSIIEYNERKKMFRLTMKAALLKRLGNQNV
jgi:hypothetical protein